MRRVALKYAKVRSRYDAKKKREQAKQKAALRKSKKKVAGKSKKKKSASEPVPAPAPVPATNNINLSDLPPPLLPDKVNESTRIIVQYAERLLKENNGLKQENEQLVQDVLRAKESEAERLKTNETHQAILDQMQVTADRLVRADTLLCLSLNMAS